MSAISTSTGKALAHSLASILSADLTCREQLEGGRPRLSAAVHPGKGYLGKEIGGFLLGCCY